jgi:hypothetical protein
MDIHWKENAEKAGGRDKPRFKSFQTKKMLRTTPQIFMFMAAAPGSTALNKTAPQRKSLS